MERKLWKTRLGNRPAGRRHAPGKLREKPGRRSGVLSAPLRKLVSSGGFSLAETLVCCLILALSSSVLIQTMRLAGEQFNTRTRESSARILCNTLSQSVQDYLSCATAWTVGADGSVTGFETGAVPSLEEPVRCSFTRTGEGFLALDYGAEDALLLLAPPADYAMQNGQPALEAEFCTVCYDEDGFFSVSIRVAPNRLGPRWGAAMQEVQNDFVVFPVSTP